MQLLPKSSWELVTGLLLKRLLDRGSLALQLLRHATATTGTAYDRKWLLEFGIQGFVK